MIEETGVVVAVDSNHLWVETTQKTTCGACASRHGCGQRVLTRLAGRSKQIQVLLDDSGSESYQPGDKVNIGIPEKVLVNAALIVYLLPLAGLIVAGWLGDRFYPDGYTSMICAVLGLFAGALAVRLYSAKRKDDRRFNPVVLGSPGRPFD